MDDHALDLSVFVHEENEECDPFDHTQCKACTRLTVALKYYSLFKMDQSNDQEIFRRFMKQVYHGVIDDYIHFKNHHEHQLQQIYQQLIASKQFSPCNLQKCIFTSRHQRTTGQSRDSTRNDANDGHTLDPILTHYKDTMDGLHFHLFHSFDAGLRCLVQETDTVNDNEDNRAEGTEIETDSEEGQRYDVAFARMDKEIAQRRDLTQSYQRFGAQNAKFNISTDDQQEEETKRRNALQLDELFKYLMREKNDTAHLIQLKQFIQNENYDTDSINYDHRFQSKGNVAQSIQNEKCLNEYLQFMATTKLSSSFSVGFRLYYWPFYKDIKELPEEEQYTDNMNDHSGYDIMQLFVPEKHTSFKLEAMNYRYMDLEGYNEAIAKTEHYMTARIFKKTTAIWYGTAANHYNVQKGDPIAFEHVLALVFYTDYTKHSAHFSATFRKRSPFETLQHVINRNADYRWMSQRLRECVECFGQYGAGDNKRFIDTRYSKYGGKGMGLKGPFYSGMGIVLSMPSFNIRLCSPTSCSKQMSVAMKFSGEKGIVLQLNNNSWQSEGVSGFNASWVSRFKEEDERLFFGGSHCIQIDSVRVKATKQNFECFIYSLYYLDTMLTAGYVEHLKLKKHHGFIIRGLIHNALHPEKAKKFDDYIFSSFEAFCTNKRQISLKPSALSRGDDKLNTLLMSALDKREHNKEEEQVTGRGDNEFDNLFKLELFTIFENIQSIMIDTTGYNGQNSWSFSMWALLALISNSGVEEVTVLARSHPKSGFNWIKDLWASSAQNLIQSYEENDYNITSKKVDLKRGKEEYYFVIRNK